VPGLYDAAMWSHDDIELFIDPVGDRMEYYQFAFDPNGTQTDLYMIEQGNTGKPYSAIWQVVTAQEKDCWTAEVAIPFAALWYRPASMWSETWAFSVSRTRPASHQDSYFSQFSPAKRYHDVVNFGTLGPIQVNKDRFALFPETPVCRLEPFQDGYRLVADLTVRNQSNAPAAGMLTFEVDGVGASGGAKQPVQIAGDGTAKILIPDAFVKAEGFTALRVKVEDAQGNLVLGARFSERLTYAPITLRVTQPNYRETIFHTQNIETIKGLVRLGVPQEQLAGLKVRVTLSSNVIAARSVEHPADALEVPFELSAKDLPVGEHTLIAELLKPIPGATPDKRQADTVAETTLILRKLGPAPWVEARIDDDGNLLIDNQPIFARGWYGSFVYGVSKSVIPAAFTPRTTNMMHGLTEGDTIPCFASLCRLIDESKAKFDQPLDEEIKVKLRSAIAATQPKRNVIGYYLSDEPECRGLSKYYLKRIYDFVRNEDPYRACLVISRDPANFTETCDIICPHPYMNPQEFDDGSRRFGGPLKGIREVISTACAQNDGSKVVWSMPQAFTYGGKYGRNPNLLESRWFAYASLAAGAKGIVPFIYCGYTTHFANKVAWDAIFEELAILERAWLERNSQTVAQCDNPGIDVIARTAKADGTAHSFIVAVNRSYDPAKATFKVESLAANRNVRLLVLRENRVIPVQDGAFTDEFVGLGAHVYTTLEVLPYLKSLDQLEAEINAGQQRHLAEGNLLADPKIKWRVLARASQYAEGEGMLRADGDLTDGRLDTPGWMSWEPPKPDKPFGIAFEQPVTFSRLWLTSPSYKNAALEVFDGKEWKRLHEWQDQFGYELEWRGAPVTTTAIRIIGLAQRRHYSSWCYDEVTEMGLYAK